MEETHRGRTALVTGAARGIGRAVAEGLARRGARVAVMDIALDAAEATAAEIGGGAIAVAGDVGDWESFQAAHAAAVARIGAFDILVNNAGISPKRDGARVPAAEMDPAEWRRVVDINLSGCFYGARLVAPAMIAARRGAIVSLSSVAGKHYSSIVGVHYAATKAAIIGLTRHLAGELGPHGIRVNAIAPGRIESPMIHTVGAAVNQAALAATPLGRLGTAAECADAIAYLTSDAASFVTGVTLDVAGGLSMT
ncbi:3-oxoacyl-[acyl-carrier protein] reductase [Stella humosa]|uniref:3-oxoacyl-[acyl-carrier protein] reductase n=1 Tax=Stella humosa TaxID=94 RepID=A0A3N1LKB4_9PROT|nr:SDR family NAD(P)-dependent oxidoreductase [Stella humosa]ROP91179.1 3-oxoacyl-[acyl-carrier protein] reductase [Stella humosa]BBK34469.1 3-ketoacyl-ACP reductase [Stella humosa]